MSFTAAKVLARIQSQWQHPPNPRILTFREVREPKIHIPTRKISGPMKKLATLILEGRKARGLNLEGLLNSLGFEVSRCSHASLRQHFQTQTPNLVIVGSWEKSAWNGVKLAQEIRQIDRRVPIILLTADSSEELAISAFRSGINDYFGPPLSYKELAGSIKRCLTDTLSEKPLVKEAPRVPEASEGEQLIGTSPGIAAIKAYLPQIATLDSTVLITGETGTGKELAAKLIHRFSRRSQRPFVVINCAAIPDTLLESELFGYERGAFTGAYSRREGAMQAANGGTVFFDEIGDMSPYAQAKILRTIENKEVCPVGGKKSLPLDIRFIAATNQNLEELMREGKFRSDLYFRLNVARVLLPPLRERKEDIVPLLEYFRQSMNRQFGKEVEGFTDKAVAALLDYDWPGNIRELKNLLEATLISAHRRIALEDFPELFRRQLQETEGLSQDERSRLLAALFNTNWNKSKAAQQLQWSRMTLYRKMAKYKITPAHDGLQPTAGNKIKTASPLRCSS